MTGTSYTRRGFLSLSAAAVAAAGLAACTGGGTAPAPAGEASAPVSNDLRMFTYEGDETIDLLKEQVAKFDAQAGTTTTIDTLPGSGAAVYPDKLRTELLGGKGPDVWRIWGGQIGAPFVEAKQAMDLTPYYQKFGWDSKINTAAIEGMTFEGVKGGVPFISLGIGAWYNKAIFEKAGITADPASYAELEEANEKLLAAGTTPLATAGKYGWHIMRLYEYLLETRPDRSCTTNCSSVQESWDRPRSSPPSPTSRNGRTRSGYRTALWAWIPPTSNPGTCRARPHTRSPDLGPRRQAIQTAKKDSADFGNFQFPTGQTPARHSGFVEGYMINARSGNPDKSAELIDFIVQAGDAEGAQDLRVHRYGCGTGSEGTSAVLSVVSGSGEAAVLHHPGPGVSEEGGRPVFRDPE